MLIVVHGRPVIAVLVDYLHGEYQLGLIRGVEEVARQAGANVLVVAGRALRAPDYLEPAQNEIYARLSAASVDGIVLGSGCLGTWVGKQGLGEFVQRFAGLPLCSVSVELPGIPSVLISNRLGTRTVVDHLIEAHGCRKIAYIRGPLDSAEAEERYEGYVQSLAEHDLELDPDLVQLGDFWIHSGARAAARLLDEGRPFDALVAANDYMALAAIDVLRERRVRLPHDVLAAGFDDIPATRTSSPSLTTVRQPIEALGRAATKLMLRRLEGEAVADRVELDVELVRRRSCGCGDRRRQRREPSSVRSGVPGAALGRIQTGGQEVLALMLESVRLPRGDLGNWPERLLRALREEFSGVSGRFLMELEELLEQLPADGVPVEDFNALIDALRTFFLGTTLEGPNANGLEDLWHSAIILVAAAANRSHVRQRISAENTHDVLRTYLDRLSTSLSHEALVDVLREMLPVAAIPSALVSVYEDGSNSTLRPLLALRPGASDPVGDRRYPSERLAPEGFFPSDRSWTYVLFPLTFDAEHLGVLLLEAGGDPVIYRQLRGQIAAAIKGAALHRSILLQTTERERVEREQLHKEALIAKQIQTAILPTILAVDGLQLAAVMIPAASVGGDYYDVLPTEEGCWMGVGDVTGHGLLAGILMLMVQSMVAGILKVNASASPAQVITALNAALFENVRGRLKRDDFATLTLFRYERSGRLTFAGCHEDFLVCRAQTRRCEQVPTPGVWAAAVPDVSQLTADAELQLTDQDLLVLYTDGVTEAMNAQRELFGLERLTALIEAHQARTPSEICAAVIAAVTAWAPSQRDDISLVIGRYTAPATPPAHG